MGISIGCDPELFVFDTKVGDFISAEGLVDGDKERPHFLQNGAVQVDGMALEFNTIPAQNLADFKKYVKLVQEEIREMLPKHLELKALPSVRFSKHVMDAASAQAKKLGCEPDFCAYTGKVNPAPDASTDETWNLRTGAGHIHIGWTDGASAFSPGHFKTCCELVQRMDLAVGMVAADWDSDGGLRRKLYGRAGAFRPKPYGVEYRTPSNSWLLADWFIDKIYDNTAKAYDEHIKAYPMLEEQYKLVMEKLG